MTTAAAEPKSAGRKFNMRERKEPRFIQFALGDCIEGVLMGVERVEINGKDAIRYTVKDLDAPKDDNLVSFLGTYQINNKLRLSDRGHYIEVRYEGEDQNVRRGNNAMRVFKVRVSDDPYEAPKGEQLTDGTYITDDDIGF